ncbi:hypothetical protein [Polystyrenella longa]|nr:hypothetical protein [Polystyrenella longa]
MFKRFVKKGIDKGEFRDTPIVNEPIVIVGPALMAAVWKLKFENAEKLNTIRWIEAYFDLVIQGLQNTDQT